MAEKTIADAATRTAQQAKGTLTRTEPLQGLVLSAPSGKLQLMNSRSARQELEGQTRILTIKWAA